MMSITILKGKTLTSIVNRDNEALVFEADDGTAYQMFHSQQCCEFVRLEEVIGDLNDLVGSPVLEAEEVSSEGHPAPEHAESYTWTFYKLGTAKGHVSLRWLGESNGYYSESVDFEKI